ncbi:hypothetical protein RIF29_31215 [Crotalaria pallida]|uniref:Uncharacterized protein n=1 Tax=Crotalaria pallida TaxID=3830 RepID=A0AAN9EHR3_CROPI
MSSISKAPSSNDDISIDSIEESGWTTYFDDFFNNNQNDNQNCSIPLSVVASSSSTLVSDAASSAAKKIVKQDEEFSVNQNTCKRTCFKKRKNDIITAALVDDDAALEDTATSPLNSPKVLYGKQFENPKQNSLQEKGNNTSGQRDEERKEMNFNGRDSDCTELKKRGLCLVPLSMVVNYLG